ncbi:MAG: DUF2617 family protein [Phycisphaerales bacterium]|nr:DUF2617 family protein [Phycisphaerales bacterium]
MNLPTKNSLQSYQVVLYHRALHPELFQLRGRKVIRHGDYELESWVMSGSHLLRFEHKSLCASELVTDQDRNLPEGGVVTAFLCAGERDYEHAFKKDRVTYMTTVQTETLSDNLFAATYEEMLDFGRESGALTHAWEDESGRCLSMIDVQRYSTEVHAQAYHLIANGGIVLRTQTIFEVK